MRHPPSLEAFLEQPARPQGTLTYHELQGFLFAVVSAPELIRPSEWLPLIFNELDPGYSTLDEANAIVGQIMALYNDINATILEERVALPGDCRLCPRALDNLDDPAPLVRWSRGFMIGHDWLEELWDVELPADLDEELGAVLMTLSFFSSRGLNARGEPGLAHVLAHEIPSADSVDLLCAFVRWHGLRLLEDQIDAHCRAGKQLRIITTVFTGSTERKALDWLVARGAKVTVSYDTQSTRLHAKAWLFRRDSGFSTAYIGSSNLSKSALVDGVEWNVRLSQVGTPDILEKFDATFGTYWETDGPRRARRA